MFTALFSAKKTLVNQPNIHEVHFQTTFRPHLGMINPSRKAALFIITAFIWVTSIGFTHAQQVSVTAQTFQTGQKANFELAERFTTQKMDKLIGSTSVYPRWIKDSDDFWYTYETAEGKQWYYVHTDERRQRPLFDRERLAAELSESFKRPFSPIPIFTT